LKFYWLVVKGVCDQETEREAFYLDVAVN